MRENSIENDPTTARWIRLPTRGRCPYSGLTRSPLYQLIHAGAVKSANIKRPGCLTGTRLIWLPSLLAFIEKHVETPDAAQKGLTQ